MGEQWHRGNYAAGIAELPGLAFKFLPFEVCLGSDYNWFFPVLPLQCC